MRAEGLGQLDGNSGAAWFTFDVAITERRLRPVEGNAVARAARAAADAWVLLGFHRVYARDGSLPLAPTRRVALVPTPVRLKARVCARRTMSGND